MWFGAVPLMAGNRIQQLEERDEDWSRDMTRVAFDGFEICTLCSLEILVSIRYVENGSLRSRSSGTLECGQYRRCLQRCLQDG